MDLSSGETTLDGIALAHLDPADLRRDVGLLSQQARLFHGTLRDNITLGAGQASDQEIIAALTVTGALDFVRQLPKGMDHLVLEGGLGLSGGQRQSLLLSRLLIPRAERWWSPRIGSVCCNWSSGSSFSTTDVSSSTTIAMRPSRGCAHRAKEWRYEADDDRCA
jgi:hypothetical protein